MANLYALGASTKAHFIPTALTDAVSPGLERVRAGHYGATTFVKAGGRFYGRGVVGYQRPPLFKSGSVGGLFSNLSDLLMDIVHFALLLVGAFCLYKAIIP